MQCVFSLFITNAFTDVSQISSLIAEEHLEIKNIILTNKPRYINMIKTENDG